MNKISAVKNPVHPFDLSLSDLILIYKKFQQVKRITNNPNQEISIDLLVQLIARLIKNQPSLLQKSLSNALYKNTISWNQFLNFLDRQSEARQNILNWIMYQINTQQYKFNRNINLKFIDSFQQITYFQSINFDNKIYYVIIKDHIKLLLFQKQSTIITSQFYLKRQKIDFQKDLAKQQTKIFNPRLSLKNKMSYIYKQSSKVQKSKLGVEKTSQSIDLSPKPSNKLISNSVKKYEKNNSNNKNYSSIQQNAPGPTQDEQYFKRQRKKINSVFEMFKQLPLQDSINLVEIVNNKIAAKKVQQINFNELRDSYGDLLNVKKQLNSKQITDPLKKRQQKVKQYLKKFYEDKKIFSYNPYKFDLKKSQNIKTRFNLEKKRLNFEKKQKQNFFSIRTLCYLEQYNIFALALYSFQIVLIRIKKQFNKTSIDIEDTLKLPKQNDRKKIQVIQVLQFYYHRILNKYQLLILIRVQGNSYVRIFNLVITQVGQKKNPQYKYTLSKEISIIQLDFQATLMIAEKDYGFHVLGSGNMMRQKDNRFHALGRGKMNSFKDDCSKYNQYYTLGHQQIFKSDLVFSCFDVSLGKKKIIFGTVGGKILFLDNLTKQILHIKKVSNKSVISIKFDDSKNQVFILSADQMITIYDTNKLSQIQLLCVKNLDRLNERINKFSISYFNQQSIIHCYGSQLRQFIPYIEEEKHNKKRKVQCTYKWRLQKIVDPNQNQKKLVSNAFITQKQNFMEQIIGVVSTDKYFVVMTKRFQIKLISKKSYIIKYSLVLDLKPEQNVITFNISKDSKMVVFSLESQKIKAINLYTQQTYLVLDIKQKITHIQFLSQRNQYFIVTGNQTGIVTFIAYNQAKLPDKMFNAHKKAITCFVIINDILMTTSQDGKFIIWQLPFNNIKYQLTVNSKINQQYIVEISLTNHLDKIFCRGYRGTIYQIDAKNGHIKQTHHQMNALNIICFAFNQQNHQLFILDENMNFTVYQYIENKHKYMPSPQKIQESPSKKAAKKQAKLSKSRSTFKNSQMINRWRSKLNLLIDQQQIQFGNILTNNLRKDYVFFCSKGGFYVYDQVQQKFRQKYLYSGQMLKNNKNIVFKRRAISALK